MSDSTDQPPASTRAARTRQAARERREHEKLELRQAIIEAASQLFTAHGYERFSLRQVAESIGYSPATIYLYFKDKDDLLFTVADEGFARFEAAMVAAVDHTLDPWPQLAALRHAYIQFGLRNPVHYQLMFMQRADFLNAPRPHEPLPRVASFSVLLDAVKRALDAGVLRGDDAYMVSSTLWAISHGIVALAIATPFFDQAQIQHISEIAGQIIEGGLRQD